jgi:hypothetical protein
MRAVQLPSRLSSFDLPSILIIVLRRMSDDDLETKIEPGMKVAVRRGVQERIAVVVRVEGEHVVVHLTQTELNEPIEFSAHRHDVRPLKGWV